MTTHANPCGTAIARVVCANTWNVTFWFLKSVS